MNIRRGPFPEDGAALPGAEIAEPDWSAVPPQPAMQITTATPSPQAPCAIHDVFTLLIPLSHDPEPISRKDLILTEPEVERNGLSPGRFPLK
jgi:hypothetical protein